MLLKKINENKIYLVSNAILFGVTSTSAVNALLSGENLWVVPFMTFAAYVSVAAPFSLILSPWRWRGYNRNAAWEMARSIFMPVRIWHEHKAWVVERERLLTELNTLAASTPRLNFFKLPPDTDLSVFYIRDTITLILAQEEIRRRRLNGIAKTS